MLIFLFSLYLVHMGNVVAPWQDKSPVTWTFEYQEKGDKIIVIARAKIDKNWAIYSQTTDDNGPVPTAFYLGDEKVTFFEKSKVIKHIDPLFEVEVKKFKNEAVFEYEWNKKYMKSQEGKVIFMCCDDEKCLPPTDVPFKISW